MKLTEKQKRKLSRRGTFGWYQHCLNCGPSKYNEHMSNDNWDNDHKKICCRCGECNWTPCKAGQVLYLGKLFFPSTWLDFVVVFKEALDD